MKNEEKALLILLLIITLLMGILGLSFGRGSRMLPLFSAGFSSLALIFLLIVSFSPRLMVWYQKFESSGVFAQESLSKEERKREVFVILWFFACTMAIYVLGFMVGMGLFLFLFLKFRAKEKWLISVVLPLVFLVIVYTTFVQILRVPLHNGILF